MLDSLHAVAGTLTVVPALTRRDLLAPAVADGLAGLPEADQFDVGVAEIDPTLADTAAFCAAYGTPLDASANCVVVAGKRSGELRYASCVVLATTRADVNGLVRRLIDARKASFAPMADAVELTGMEFGGITPVGLPACWPVLVDRAVADAAAVVIGSGLRRSKLVVPGRLLGELPGVQVCEGLGRPAG